MTLKKYTDLQLLSALLALPMLKQKRAFQGMYDALCVGGQVSLSKKQRQWVEQVFLEHKLDKKPLPRKVPKTLDPGKKDLLDFGPIPKPPNRS